MVRLLPTFVVVSLLVSAAQANERCPTKEAIRLYNEGKIALKKGDSETTAKRWEAAYAECPSSNLLYNLAQIYRKLGRNKEALALYASYLDDTPDVPPAERAEINARMDDLREALRQEEANATKPPDGLKEPDDTPSVREEPLARQDDEHDLAPAWYSDTWGWVLAASGLVAVGVGGGMLAHASALRDDADNALTEERQVELDESADDFRFGGWIALGVGSVALTIGVIKLAIRDGGVDERGHHSSRVQAACGFGWCGLQGRF